MMGPRAAVAAATAGRPAWPLWRAGRNYRLRRRGKSTRFSLSWYGVSYGWSFTCHGLLANPW